MPLLALSSKSYVSYIKPIIGIEPNIIHFDFENNLILCTHIYKVFGKYQRSYAF